MAQQRPERQPRNAWVPDDPPHPAVTDDEALARAAEIVQRLSAQASAPPPEPVEKTDPKPPPVLVSTAQGYTIGSPPVGNIIRPAGQNSGWNQECWAFYDAVGELHYVAGQYGRAVSRARLYVAKYNDDNEIEEATSGNARALNRDLLGGEARAGDLLYLSAVQQFMTGQSLITISDSDGWDAFSDQDFTVDRTAIRRAATGGSGVASPYKVDVGTGTQSPLAAGVHTIHMWDRHPGKASTVDSSVRAALPYLRELARLDQYVQSVLLSRIALSGILQIPPGTEVVVPPELASQNLGSGSNGLMAVLAQIGVHNISNPGTAAAVLPVLLQLNNKDHKLEHLTLDTPLTAEVNAFREINLKRTAMSMDMAPEAMSGFSDVKYSNAEWIQDESVKTHIVRRVAAFASALTSFWVVPALGNEYVCAYDVSDLESDADQTEAGIALYDRGELDGDGLRRLANVKGKAPEGEELLRQLAVRAVTANPSLFPALAPLLGLREVINLTPQQQQQLTQTPDSDSGTGPQPIPDAAPPSEPVNAPPNLPTVRGPQPLPSSSQSSGLVSDALVAACDVVVCSALASAGSRWRKRARARAAQCRGTEPSAVYLVHPLCADRGHDETPAEHAAALVADRWPQVPRIAALHAADPTCLQRSLASYVVDLIVEQKPHHPAALAEQVCGCVTNPSAASADNRVEVSV